MHKTSNPLSSQYILVIGNIRIIQPLNNQSPLGMVFAYKLINHE